MFCIHCGKEIEDTVEICPFCEKEPAVKKVEVEKVVEKVVEVPVEPKEKVSVGWVILSILEPIVGLVLYLLKKDNEPKTANACGIAALVSVIVGVLILVIYMCLVVSMFTPGHGYMLL